MRAFVIAAAALALAGQAAAARPRVTLITDSVAGALYWVTDARLYLADGLDFRLEVKTCRKLVETGCPAYGETPESALELIERRGEELGPVVVVAVGYNDRASEYDVDEVMRALLAEHVERVVWVTLEELHDPWPALNDEIRAAARRWPELLVADWAAASADKPWFEDGPHMGIEGAMHFAEFLRPYVLEACACAWVGREALHLPTRQAFVAA